MCFNINFTNLQDYKDVMYLLLNHKTNNVRFVIGLIIFLMLQVWPISCLIGTMTGYLIGLLFGAIHIYRHGDDYVDNYAKYKIR